MCKINKTKVQINAYGTLKIKSIKYNSWKSLDNFVNFKQLSLSPIKGKNKHKISVQLNEKSVFNSQDYQIISGRKLFTTVPNSINNS